jgi:hypothetical protein
MSLPTPLKPGETWKPRASGIGAYQACLWRVANDRAIAEGRITPDDARGIGEWEDTGYAPHGSAIHWTAQAGACEFPSHEAPAKEVMEAAEHFDGDPIAAAQAFRDGNPLAWKPTEAEWKLAATLFAGNAEAHLRVVASVAQLVVNRLPKSPDGKKWVAETSWTTDWCTGHIDFLPQDLSEIGDLKTTSKPPEMGGYVKPMYLAQVIAYGRMVKQATGVQPKRAWLLYADAQKAAWSYFVPLDLTTPERLIYAENLEGFARFLMSDLLWSVAFPNPGHHCDENFCPYRKSCVRKLMPTGGQWHDAKAAVKPFGVMARPSPSSPLAGLTYPPKG